MLVSAFVSILALRLASCVRAAIVEYTWDITYVNANPDGYERRVIGINGAWPCPIIEATVGDTIRIHMTNRLDDQTTGIHFHGINQVGTPWQDGPSGVTQCPVPPGNSITYEFLADAPGTYWYHSHEMGQFPDGLRGPLIVHDLWDPWKNQYDEEYIVTISDWYKSQSLDLVRGMIVPTNTLHTPPLGTAGPDNMLVNDGRSVDYPVEVGKTYRFRFINMAAISAFFIHFDSHEMNVIMQDASYVEKEIADQLRIAAGQRYDLLITIANEDAGYNHPFLIAWDFHKDYRSSVPATWHDKFNKRNVSGYLILDPEFPRLDQKILTQLNPFDDSTFKPHDSQPVWGPVTREIVLDFTAGFDKTFRNPIMALNDIAYVPQIVPTLYSASSLGEYNTNETVYGQVNPYILAEGTIVQIIINNNDTGIHPFHLHGHQFQVLYRAAKQAGIWQPGQGTGSGEPPPRRDTIDVEPNSYVILRIKITEPGVFLLHCHIEWHIIMGSTATFIQIPEKLRNIQIPSDHLQVCQAAGIPTTGNAAGNTDPFNQTGFKTVHDYPYTGSQWPHPIGGGSISNSTQRLSRKWIGHN